MSYTVSDAISCTYGTEEIEVGKHHMLDAEYSGITASYTAGGMTISAYKKMLKTFHHGTGATEDQDTGL